LRDEHVGDAVAVEVTEARIAARAPVRNAEFLPQLGFGIVGAQARQLSLAFGDAILDGLSATPEAVTRKSVKRPDCWR
jgi:hypothetical protein